MATQTDSQLKSQKNTLFADNVTRDITEEDLRNHLEDLIDSKVNVDKIGAASGVAGLDSGSKVPVAQLPVATTSANGVVELAADGEASADKVVQGNDSRLLDPWTYNETSLSLNGTIDIDADQWLVHIRHYVQKSALSGPTTLNIIGGSDGDLLELYVKLIPSGGETLSFHASIKWFGSAPTIDNTQDNYAVLQFRRIDSRWHGAQLL